MLVIVVGADKDRHISLLGRLEEALDVFDGLVFGHTVADNSPCHSFGAEEIILRIGDNHCDLPLPELHSRTRNGGIGTGPSDVVNGLCFGTH